MTTSNIALSLALVLATVSAAVAAPKEATLHQTTIQQRVSWGSHLSLNSVPSTGSVGSTDRANYSNNVSQREYEGLASLIEAIDEIGK